MLLFGVMLILHIHCLFVLLRLARGYESFEDHPGTWNLKSQVKNRYHRMRRMEDAVMSL
uniref:Uncharacterized protein n=1 Tax=Zea mays TaxID=4577 RepID=B6T065_MAIZE|nr:hypothetical protein [Zea mays]